MLFAGSLGEVALPIGPLIQLFEYGGHVRLAGAVRGHDSTLVAKAGAKLVDMGVALDNRLDNLATKQLGELAGVVRKDFDRLHRKVRVGQIATVKAEDSLSGNKGSHDSSPVYVVVL